LNLETLITLIVVVGIVWGGFSFFLSKAVKHESRKKAGEK